MGLCNPRVRHDHQYKSRSEQPQPHRLEENQAERRPDSNSGYSEGTNEPSEPVLDGDQDKGKVEGGSEGGLELREGHDERLRLLSSLGGNVLQRGDGSEDLSNTDEDVRSRNGPKVVWGRVGGTIGILTPDSRLS